MAADYVVNNIINEYVKGDLKNFVEFWDSPKPLLDNKYDITWSVKTIFEDLQKKQKQNPKASQGQAMDDHATEKNSDGSTETKAARKQALNNAMAEGIKAQKKAGNMQGWMGSFILEAQQPKINWRSKVVEFLTNKQAGDDRSDWRKPRGSWLANGFYRPRRYDETLNKVACGIDVSGSIYSAPAMSLFLSEFMGLTKEVGYKEINMLYWDTHITKEETYDTANPFTLAKTKPSGGGGTNPECVRAHLGKHNTPDFLLMFTDGEVPDWGEGKWPCPVLWVVVDNPTATPTCGNVIHIKL
jgi:predicted metal-dependent peptidase